MSAQRWIAGALAGALTMTAVATPAHALVVARVTRRGYILVDDPGTVAPYDGLAPVSDTRGTLYFVAEVTAALDAIGAPHADYIAEMQTSYERQALAFYLGLINNTYGVGQRSPLGDNREVYNINNIAGTAWPVTGYVFLNTIELYLGTRMTGRNLGPDVICTQEFGHRYGTFLRIPPQPGMPMPEGTDAGAPDATPEVDASVEDANTDDASANPEDAGAPDVTPPPPPPPPGPDLAADALLGRQRAHWSYFVNSGGSPMEGNNWEETSPGVFTTRAYTVRFSPLDLYIMGLIPASQVPPFWVIAEPNVNGQRDDSGQLINRESGPESRSGRNPVTIRGRRVTYTIDDIIRANGRRLPEYRAPDAGVADGGSSVAQPDLNVAWVLLTTRERVTDTLAANFDRAIESCGTGYSNAAQNLSRLVPMVGGAVPDASVEMPDAATDDAPAETDAAPAGDAGTSDAAPNPMNRAAGGCGCAVPGESREGNHGRAALLLGLGLAGTVAARRRARRTRQ